MITGKTKNGFEFCIDEDDVNDMEFIEMLAEADNDACLIPKIVESLLGGKEEKQRLYEFLRNEKGKVPATAVTQAVIEIMEAGGEALKNS